MAIQVQDLQFQYNSQNQFKFPNFGLTDNEQMLVLGESGKGKTTLLHLLGGLLTPQYGKIIIDDIEVHQLSSRKMDQYRGAKIGIVFQKPYFVKSLSVKDNLFLAQKLAGLKENEADIKAVLEKLAVDVKLNALTNELSVGEQQRLSIARAVIKRPSLILADEPTSALDDGNAERVAELLISSAQSQQSNLIVVTHDRRLKEKFNKHIEI